MTNKLPEVGKKYKRKGYCVITDVSRFSVLLDDELDYSLRVDTDRFFNLFEELPEDKAETKMK